MAAVLRDACDACHKRKMRCPPDGVGACLNCRRTGQVCQYSPRCEMGRPRLTSPTKKRTRVRRGGKKATSVAGGSSIDAGSPHSARASSPKSIAPLHREVDMFAGTAPEYTTMTSEVSPETRFWDTASAESSIMSEFSVYDAASWAGSTMGSSTGSPAPTLMFNPNINGLDPWTSADPAIHIWNSDAALSSPSSVLPGANNTEPGANPKRSPDENHPGLPDTAPMVLPTAPNRLYEAYCQLSSILYALQTLSPYRSDLEGPASPITRDHSQQSRTIDQIFAQVSSLCDTMAWTTANMPISTSASTNGDVDVVPFLLIVTSLATTVSAIYTQRLDKYKAILRHQHHGGALVPGLQIQILTDATTMEFHLGQLGRALMDAPAQEICDAQTVAKLEGLRMSVKGFVDECRV